MYAITGITGHVGRVAAKLLLEKNLPVRAVLRNPVKGGEWKNKGTEVAIAELHDAVSLENAFKDTSGVFVMTPPLFDSNDPLGDHNRMLDALVTAIKKAKPQKVVYLSSVGAHLENGTGAIRKLYDMEQTFKTLDIPTASIRAAWFMENFQGNIAYAKDSGRLPSFLNPLDLSIPMVSAVDIGKLAADLLQENWEGHRILELSGPCSYSANDVAYILSYRLNRPVKAEVIPAERYATSYESFGFTSAASQLMAEMNEGFNKEHIIFEKTGQEQVAGKTLLEDAINSYVIE
ncbi:NmrA family NAD(P)-binding protein [Mucilaginibacter sp. McL0603]|uniref:NmrA family NAD(P)-binding protein n=1 Tax=Mucilaginibacter sp. McL0603 TaxID=3415670 RepID=UPI003CF66582